MAKALWEIEGTWEEIAARAQEFAGRKVRLTLLDETAEDAAHPSEPPVFRPAEGPSTVGALLQFSGTWVGDDLKECLEEVYATRSRARF